MPFVGARTDLKDTLESEKDSLNISIRQIQRYARMYNLILDDILKEALDMYLNAHPDKRR